MGLFDALFGGGTKKVEAGEASQSAYTGQAAQGAQKYMTGYDAATASDMAGGAAATMDRAREAARAGAAAQSDEAIAQAVKAGRTSGMMPGQAALGAGAQAAGTYGQGIQQGVQQFGENVTREAQLGESMSQRLARAAEQENAVNIVNAQMKTQAGGTESQRPGLFGQIAGAAAGIGSLFSDKNLKENIKPSGSISDSLAKIKSYSYKYKTSNHPERGVMAQELEKTEAAPAVVDTPQGKMVDTDRLATINTAAIGEQGRRIKDIEKMIREFRGIKNA